MAEEADSEQKSPPRSPRKIKSPSKGDDEESAKRLALLRDARRKSPQKETNYDNTEVDIGQKKVGKKAGGKLQDSLPLIPKHLKKQLTGGKEHPHDKDFYKAFKYIYVDIPEPEEDFPCESALQA